MTNQKFPGFKFKKFSVKHDKCAMKVGTDSIVLGSWCQPGQARHILDIGTGSGLLSLMLAQKAHLDAKILAVEPDFQAAQQAIENVLNSPWPEKISVVNLSIQDWSNANTPEDISFDVIISNPPWFEFAESVKHNLINQQRDSRRTAARQMKDLNLEVLFDVASRYLSPTGQLYLVLPEASEMQVMDLVNSSNLACAEKFYLKNSASSVSHAILWCLVRDPLTSLTATWNPEISSIIQLKEQHLIIRDQQNHYTHEFKTLCRDYYLKF